MWLRIDTAEKLKTLLLDQTRVLGLANSKSGRFIGSSEFSLSAADFATHYNAN
jgi:hypothetical protein